MIEMDELSLFENFFIKPEYTNSKCCFCDIPKPISFRESNVNVIGLPIDITTTFGKTTSYGPESIRITSANQVETFVYEKNLEVFDKSLIYDLGDLLLSPNKNFNVSNKSEIKSFWNEFDGRIPKLKPNWWGLIKNPLVWGGNLPIPFQVFKKMPKKIPC